MSSSNVPTAERMHRMASWRTDDAAAWELCHAATRRVIERLRSVNALPNDTFTAAWSRMVGAMADEADPERAVVDDRNG